MERFVPKAVADDLRAVGEMMALAPETVDMESWGGCIVYHYNRLKGYAPLVNRTVFTNGVREVLPTALLYEAAGVEHSIKYICLYHNLLYLCFWLAPSRELYAHHRGLAAKLAIQDFLEQCEIIEDPETTVENKKAAEEFAAV